MSRARQLVDRRNFDSLVMDASAASTDVNDTLLLDGTDSSSTDAGFRILTEDFGTHVPYDSIHEGNRELTDDAIYFEVAGIPTGYDTISTNTVTTCDYDRIMKDHNGNANIATDLNKFTVPVSGLYYLEHTAYVYLGSAHASILSYNYVYLHRNGVDMSSFYRTQGYSGGSGYQWHMYIGTNTVKNICWLKKDDEIEPKIYLYKLGGILGNYMAGSGTYPTFKGYLIKRLPNA